MQLEMIEIVNFIDFYEDHKKSHEVSLVEIMGWNKKSQKLVPNQLELIGMLFSRGFENSRPSNRILSKPGLRATFTFRKLRVGESLE